MISLPLLKVQVGGALFKNAVLIKGLTPGVWDVQTVKSYGAAARWAATTHHKAPIWGDINRSSVATIE